MSTRSEIAPLARGTIGLGFEGADPASAPLDALRRFAPGAVVLFARNVGGPAQLRALVGALRDGAAPPPLVAIDQEGGRVARIRSGVTQIPAAMAVGATGDVALARGMGTLVGRDLARLGISVDFAPVADLALEPASTVIGTRAYGDDPETVASFAIAFARGLEAGGVAAAVKHFPGHGSTARDSHAELPRVEADAATLRARDLVPFARVVTDGASSIVMTAHVVLEAFDPGRPATLSPAVIGGLLRDELGFEGVVSTDCLEMDAIANGVGTPAGAVAALAAGADLLLISHRLSVAEAAVAAIVDAVERGELAIERVEQACARVMRLRERLARLEPFGGVLDEDAGEAAARGAVTVLRGDPRLREGAVTVLSFEGALSDRAARSGGDAHAEEGTSLSAALRRRGWKSEIMRVPLEPDAGDIDLLLEHVGRLGGREFVVVMRRAHLHPAQREAIARIVDAVPDALLVSAREPFDATLFPRARRVVCIYGDEAQSFDGCADVLSGRVEPRGHLPVRLPAPIAVR